MKRNWFADISIICVFLLPIILGEFVFGKVYMMPTETINFYIFSFPVYNSFSFYLKVFVFDIGLWNVSKNLFITRKYYGFPYPEFMCHIFAFITLFNYIYVIGNLVYLLFYMGEFWKLVRKVEGLILLINKETLLTVLIVLLSFLLSNISDLLPVLPLVILYIVSGGIIFFQHLYKIEEKDDTSYRLWQQNVVMPGESGFRSNHKFYYRLYGVFICYIIIYRFIVLLNIHLSHFEIIGILLGLITLFFAFECNRYKKQMKEDRHFIYERIAKKMHFEDGMHWRDLVDFQILELQRLKKIEEKYKNSKIRNIRWLELYEHMIINDAKSIYDAIENWEDGIYSIEKAIEEIKPRISSIEKISIDCIPILPGRKFNPKEVNLITFFQEQISLIGGIFLNKELIDSYIGFADLSDLHAIIEIVKKYLLSFSVTLFSCNCMTDNAGWLNVEFISSELRSLKMHTVQKDIKNLNNLWEESRIINYCNFPVELAVARSYMKDIDGDMSIILEGNRLKFILDFPNIYAFNNYSNNNDENDIVEIGKFLEKYTFWNKHYVPFHSTKKIHINADSGLLKEIMDHIAWYSDYRIEDNSSIFINIEESEDMIVILLSFLFRSRNNITQEIQETLHYWRTRKDLVPEHTSLSLLMMKNKMEQLSGSVNLSLTENGYFYCHLKFKKYEEK